MANHTRVGLTPADKAKIAKSMEDQAKKRESKPSLLEADQGGMLLDKPKTPFSILKLKRSLLGYIGREKDVLLYELAMEMTKAGYPREERILEAAERYIGEGKRLGYTGFMGMKGVLNITRLDKGKYRVSSAKPSKK